jgi:pimeloyl-ACP methyl ester carboxylesterase
MLRVSPVHTLRWEESGNPEGKPVVFLHGGPGGGCVRALCVCVRVCVWFERGAVSKEARRGHQSACESVREVTDA